MYIVIIHHAVWLHLLLGAPVRCPRLLADQDIYPAQDQFELGVRKPTHRFGELGAIDREDLGDIGD
jgi:hypothetical protein